MKLLREITDKDIIGDERLSSATPRLTGRAILFDDEGHIAVMYAKKFSLYSLPGGGIEENEDKLEAVKREILEETGCNCEITKDLGYVYENRAHCDFTQYSYYYLAKVIGHKGLPQMTPSEINNGTTVEWHTVQDAIYLISAPSHETLQRKFIQCKDMAALEELKKYINL